MSHGEERTYASISAAAHVTRVLVRSLRGLEELGLLHCGFHQVTGEMVWRITPGGQAALNAAPTGGER